MTLDEETLAILQEFAHGLVKPGRETRMIVLKDAVPEIGAASGDLVVYAASHVCPVGKTWLVLKELGRDGKPVYSVDQVRLTRQVCGRVLFTVHC